MVLLSKLSYYYNNIVYNDVYQSIIRVIKLGIPIKQVKSWLSVQLKLVKDIIITILNIIKNLIIKRKFNDINYYKLIILTIINYSKAIVKSYFQLIYWLFLPDYMFILFLRQIYALFILWSVMKIWKIFFWKPLQDILIIIQGFIGGKQHRQRLMQAKYCLDNATTYIQWSKAARKLDEIQGLNETWKSDPRSPYYDHERLRLHLFELRKLVDATLHDSEQLPSLINFLRSCLVRNIAGIGDSRLYSVLRDGTKSLIEDYLAEVVRALQLITAIDSQSVTNAEKLSFLQETRHSFGRSALMFSGGATLGMYHLGTVRALMNNNLLPRIISGSSVGAVIASIIGTKTRNELKVLFNNNDDINLHLNFFPPSKGALSRRVQRFLKNRVFMDISILEKALRANVPDMTFQEAFDRTGWIINIVISPSQDNKDCARLLNYLTAPNVLMWSAALASAAIPLVYSPVQLKAKNELGEIIPYLPSTSWVDGSVFADLPMSRLSELFNVNHYIVSQANPHIVPFLIPEISKSRGIISPYLRWSLTIGPKIVEFVRRNVKSFATNLHHLGIFPKILDPFYYIIDQKYVGDITIVPPIPLKSYTSLLSNPTTEKLRDAMAISERECFSHLARIRSQCEIEFTLDESVKRIRAMLIHATTTTTTTNNNNNNIANLTEIKRTQSWCPEQFSSHNKKLDHNMDDNNNNNNDWVPLSINTDNLSPSRSASHKVMDLMLHDTLIDQPDDVLYDIPPYRRPRGRCMSETDLTKGLMNRSSNNEVFSTTPTLVNRAELVWSESNSLELADSLFVRHEKELHFIQSPLTSE